MGKYTIQDGGEVMGGVKIFDPSGVDITDTVKGYKLEHEVGGRATLQLTIISHDVEVVATTTDVTKWTSFGEIDWFDIKTQVDALAEKVRVRDVTTFADDTYRVYRATDGTSDEVNG